jgi:hypothetical protein
MTSSIRVTDELEMAGMNAAEAYPRYHHGICLEVLRNNTKILSGQSLLTPRFELSNYTIRV